MISIPSARNFDTRFKVTLICIDMDVNNAMSPGNAAIKREQGLTYFSTCVCEEVDWIKVSRKRKRRRFPESANEHTNRSRPPPSGLFQGILQGTLARAASDMRVDMSGPSSVSGVLDLELLFCMGQPLDTGPKRRLEPYLMIFLPFR
ncbi:uncharacterized protein V6R79_008297 [Siganus canaliculatus]